ncbi:MAG: potassium transporter TrkA [Chloroflexi bacterium]|nr:MAG: potassium transporter TrkA [Chloroflexota bacterium]
MKFLIPHLYFLLKERPNRVNIANLLRFVALLAGLITLYSVAFHYIMAYEGNNEHSWVTGFYWTLTVMSTLGFGDITFHSDLGRLFSTLVLLSGIVMLLVVFPFTFIQFFYAPWLKAQAAARAPSELPEKTRGHVILTTLDDVVAALIERLRKYQIPYVLLVADLTEALRLYDLGYKVVVGDLDNPETYRRVRVDQALLVATTANDRVNTNIASTVREVSEVTPIVATANQSASVDILELAGCNHVLQLGEMMGEMLARRVMGGGTLAHVIGEFGDLRIAEATANNTALLGKTLRESRLRERVGITVLGVWERGHFEAAGPDTYITPKTDLMLAGSEEAIARYNELLCKDPVARAPMLIIGGGRVGRATGRALAERGLDYRIVEMLPERIRDPEKYVLGDAAALEVLEQAGIRTTGTVVITSHDDDTNIYLTIYCRRLRPDIQIISRARLERNVATLHRAGADFVLSYASMGAHTILNLLQRSNTLMVAEGLDIFRVKVPRSLVGRTLAEVDLRSTTGCTVVALMRGEKMEINPDPHRPLPPDIKLVLIGASEAEDRFLARYGKEIE